jgi:phosphohistidine phosphatase
MRRLLLLRHAKSDWDVPVDHDRDRPLKRSGEEHARLMGEFLSAIGHVPDRVVTSPAVRARRTAELAAAAGKWTSPVELKPELYDASPFAALRVMQGTDDRHETLLLSGHEPTMSELVLELCSGRVGFPTAAVARIDLPERPWQEQQLADGELAWLVPPKLLLKAGLKPPGGDDA